MKTSSAAVINDLILRTEANLRAARELNKRTEAELNYRPAPQAWSAMECIEHLNFYGNYYLPEIAQQIATSPYAAEGNFKSGFLGNYFAQSMLPKEGMKKMKTLRSSNPMGKKLDKEVLQHFMAQQQQLLDLLKKAKHVSLTRTKTGISISKYIRLRVGDTFRVVVYHNQRHLLQAKRALESITASEAKV
ncbi:DinB family protein [Salinimicrobium oceani]|uniref:DinB family protein n=1 Tax=Salinimicrobium oceani TaxID=2722702 RepID=A0ABX1CZC6_9FLAO|nr:DinB family protein [Salinimicrobium oceani]NJW53615.1 DinB family protein [Salinimicrobium oceani]